MSAAAAAKQLVANGLKPNNLRAQTATAPRAHRPPNLVHVNRPRYPPPTSPRSLANAPSGVQLEHVRATIGDNGHGGVWICPLQRLVVRYCDQGGSSRGLRCVFQ